MAACIVILAGGAVIAAQPAALPPGLGFTAAGKEFHFDTGVLRGTLHAGGRSFGLSSVVEAGSGKTVTSNESWAPYGLFALYRALATDARFGTAIWDWSSRASLLDSGAVEVMWSADKSHPFDMTAQYRFSAPDTLDFTVMVAPRKDLPHFELFLASYFNTFPASFAYVRARRQAGFHRGRSVRRRLADVSA